MKIKIENELMKIKTIKDFMYFNFIIACLMCDIDLYRIDMNEFKRLEEIEKELENQKVHPRYKFYKIRNNLYNEIIKLEKSTRKNIRKMPFICLDGSLTRNLFPFADVQFGNRLVDVENYIFVDVCDNGISLINEASIQHNALIRRTSFEDKIKHNITDSFKNGLIVVKNFGFDDKDGKNYLNPIYNNLRTIVECYYNKEDIYNKKLITICDFYEMFGVPYTPYKYKI